MSSKNLHLADENEHGNQEVQVKLRPQMRNPMQKCAVCGFDAYYSFYGVVACDPCRTFFRRSVLSKEVSFVWFYDHQLTTNLVYYVLAVILLYER